MVLITGATGLLGSYLARLLVDKGEKVRAIKRSTSHLHLLEGYADKIEWVDADILDVPAINGAMAGVDKVYHCAAVISFHPRDTEYMMKVNVDGAANVMNAALANGVGKVVHVSSVAAFGIAPEGKIIDEKFSDPRINKAFWYYKSKHYGEREAWRAHAEGLNVVVACPGTIIGAGRWDDEPNSLFREIYNGLKFYTTATNGFVDVRDVTECLYRLMESDISGDNFIVNAENLSFKEVIWMMADAMQVKRPNIKAGKLVRSLAWRMEALKHLFSSKEPLITRESAALAAVNFVYSNQKIVDAFNYRFKPLKETIGDTAAAYLKSRKAAKDWGVFT